MTRPGGFTSLALDGVCTVTSTRGIDVSPERRAHDAYAALAHLRTLPSVDASRVGLMGGSHGGSRTLASMMTPSSNREPPAADTSARCAAAERAGYPVTIKIYPGAHHSFDGSNPVRYVEARVNPSVPTGRGATTGGDPAAWADSIREVSAFFARYLK